MIDERQMTIADVGAMPDAAEIDAVERQRMERSETDTREWIAGHPIHPAASMLPLFEEEDLESLTESIRQQGQKVPIVRNKDGEIVDGRNRLLACERAGVEPQFVEDDSDPLDAVEAFQAERRNINRSQKTMFVAYLRHLRKEQGKKRDVAFFEATLDDAAEAHDVSVRQLTYCNVIIKHSPQLVADVIRGRMTINEAYDEARVLKDSKSRRAEMEATLQEKAPDLWQLVTDGSMLLPQAIRCLESRDREDHARAVSLARNMSQGFRLLDPEGFSIEEQVENWLSVRPEVIGEDADFSADRARRIAEALTYYADQKEAMDA